MAVSDDIVLFGLSVATYIIFAVTWKFKLFSAKSSDNEQDNNAIQMMIVWLLFWLQPLLVQLSLEIADGLSRSADIITLLETYYEVTVWIGWIASVYFLIMFGYNVLLWLGWVTKR